MANPRFARFDSSTSAGGSASPEDFPNEPQPPASSASPGFSLDMVYFTLFRHKWKILACAALGLAAAGVAYLKAPAPYYSQAKVLIRYVEEATAPSGLSDEPSIKRTDPRGDKILSTETNILTSHDLAVKVVDAMGVKEILGVEEESPELKATASTMLNSSLRVNLLPWSSVVVLSFEHANPELVQKVLSQYVKSYLALHAEVHRVSYDEVLVQETDQLRAKLQQTEEELRGILQKAGVVSVDDAKSVFAGQSARLQSAIMDLESDLAGSKATLSALTGAAQAVAAPEEAVSAPIPEDKITTYQQVTALLDTLYAREKDLLLQFTPETSPVKGIRAQIAENESIKMRLEKDYPGILAQRRSWAKSTPTGSSASPAFDPTIEAAHILSLETRLAVMRDQLARVRSDAANLSNLETSIREIERRKELLARQYNLFAENLERNRINQEMSAGRVSNIKVLEEPTPPFRDSSKLKKLMFMLAGGGFALGIGLAFGLEMFLDQSVKRPAEVESVLGLPLVMSIPRMKRRQMRAAAGAHDPKLLEAGDRNQGSGGRGQKAGVGGPSSGSAALSAWSADHELRTFFDALRNRLIYSFEMRAITRKPKLVAVTSCGPDSGVSTVAAGLAASLSETGDGNVLLVDMNPDRKTPQLFQKGNLKVGLDDVLTEETRDDAMVQENLYMVSQQTAEDRLSWIMPKRFAQLVPKMKASDFDYIIFDMPPVSQISATPQLARFMDQVLMVVESEKTSRDAVKRAGAMLAEAGANVGVVLNKTKSYVPKALDHDALAS